MTNGPDATADTALSHRTYHAMEPIEGPTLRAQMFALDQHKNHWRNRSTILNIADTMLGGHILALGMKATALMADEAAPVAAHILLLSGPDPKHPCDFRVENIRDGRRLAHRSASISQGDRLRARITGSFAHPPLGQRRSDDHPVKRAPPVPEPEHLPTRQQLLDTLPARTGSLRRGILRGHPFLDIREVPCPRAPDGMGMFWVRVPDAKALEAIDHYCLLALISDYWFPLPLHNIGESQSAVDCDLPVTSLDHALWFHAQPDCSDWNLFQMRASAAAGGLGTLRGEAWNRAGEPVATFVQMALTVSAQHKSIAG